MEEQTNDDTEQSEPAKKKKLFNKWQQELLDSPHAKTIIEFAKNLKRKDELKKAEEEGKLTEVFYLMKTHLPFNYEISGRERGTRKGVEHDRCHCEDKVIHQECKNLMIIGFSNHIL